MRKAVLSFSGNVYKQQEIEIDTALSGIDSKYDFTFEEKQLIAIKSIMDSNTATNLSNSLEWHGNGKSYRISGYALEGSFHVYKEVISHYYLVLKHFLQKGLYNWTQFKNS